MAVMDLNVWDLSAASEIPASTADRGVPRRRHSRWQALGRILSEAALAAAMTDPGIHSTVFYSTLHADSLERAGDGR